MGEIKNYLESRGFHFIRDSHNEWKSPCPQCGGEDRFFVNDESDKFWCRQCGLKGQAVDYLKKCLGDVVTKPSNRNGKSGDGGIDYDHPEMVHRYTDGGKLAYEVCRYHTPEGKKTFKIRTSRGWGLNGQKPILYNKDAVKEAHTVLFLEGEKCCDLVNSLDLGAVATTTPMGAGKVSYCLSRNPEIFVPMHDTNVVILPDQDVVGERHAQDVARALFGRVESLKIVRLDGLQEKEDIVNYFERHGKEKTIADLVSKAREAQEWEDTPDVNPEGIKGTSVLAFPSMAMRLTEPELLDALKNGVRGDAELFCKLFGGRLVYDHSAGQWYRFDEHYWRKDMVQQVLHDVDQIALQYELFVTLIINRVREAAAENNKEEQRKQQALEKEIRARIKSLKGESWTKDVLLFAGSGEHDWSLSTTGLEWDKDPFALAVQNGIIDLSDGSLRKGTPADFIRVVAPTEWLGLEEPCPMWEQFLGEVFSSNLDIIPFMQRLLGHALLGQVYEHIFPVFWGVGRNGKGTMLEVVKAVLGEYAGAVPKESIMSHKIGNASGAARADIMDFQGKRLMWASETDEGKNLDVSKVKWLTGGDTLKGRAPYGKQMIEFAPSHTLFLITNHKPRIGGDDQAIFDRLRLIPFIERFVDDPHSEHEHKANKFLKEKLLSEAPGILAWMVRGCIEWQKDRRFNAPDVVKNLTDEYQHEEDTIFQFIDQCCVTGTESIELVGEEPLASKLYEVFTNWMKSQGLFAWSNKRFSASMEQKGYQKGRRASGIFYQGVFLRQDL